jgi:hypothetical protein
VSAVLPSATLARDDPMSLPRVRAALDTLERAFSG